jgi:hypothetical protein
MRARSISASDSFGTPFASVLDEGDEGDVGRASVFPQDEAGVEEDVNEKSPDEYCELDCA